MSGKSIAISTFRSILSFLSRDLPYSLSFNVSGEEQTRALLIAGWEKDGYSFSDLLAHVEWVLQQKRFTQIEPLAQPSLAVLENTMDTFDPNTTHQLLVYLIGLTEEDTNQDLLFLLNPNETLNPDTLNIWLDAFPSSSRVVFLDAPGAEDFFKEATEATAQPSADRIYLWSASSGQAASFEQGGFPAF